MIKNIAQIIALDESLPDSMFYWNMLSKNPDFPDWCDAGYFSRCEDAEALSCPECHVGFVDVVWNKDKFGNPHGFRCCPNCGCEEINPNEVRGGAPGHHLKRRRRILPPRSECPSVLFRKTSSLPVI